MVPSRALKVPSPLFFIDDNFCPITLSTPLTPEIIVVYVFCHNVLICPSPDITLSIVVLTGVLILPKLRFNVPNTLFPYVSICFKPDTIRLIVICPFERRELFILFIMFIAFAPKLLNILLILRIFDTPTGDILLRDISISFIVVFQTLLILLIWREAALSSDIFIFIGVLSGLEG